jgi:hypothetical protein
MDDRRVTAPDHQPGPRVVEVGAGRLRRWCEGFAERHGGPPAVTRCGPGLVLTGPDGATATLIPGFGWPEGLCDLSAAFSWVVAPRRCAVVLVRRGGYACALVDTGRPGSAALTASKIGTRYVQSRTAAGGWSQQRFARRRANQARDLARSVTDVADRLLRPGPADWLVTGGDRPLVDAVLADSRLRALAALPRGPHLAIGDPRAAVHSLPELMAAVRIRLTDPPHLGQEATAAYR